MLKKIRHISSYLLPVTIEQVKGEVTPYLEVNLHSGKYQLDTDTVNYSFGGLHTVFEETFDHFNLSQLSFENAIVLGLGAGSVVNLLSEKYKIECKITGVEKDKVVIDLAKKYFDIERYKNLEIIHDGAQSFAQKTEKQFDLIIMDVFINDDVPKVFQEENFLNHLNRILSGDGILFYNFMTCTRAKKGKAKHLAESMSAIFGSIIEYKVNVNYMENTILIHDRVNRLRSTPILVKTEKDIKKEWNLSAGLSPSFG